MLNWWFVGRQTVVDVVLGARTSIFIVLQKKSRMMACMAWFLNFRVIPLRGLNFGKLVQIFILY